VAKPDAEALERSLSATAISVETLLLEELRSSRNAARASRRRYTSTRRHRPRPSDEWYLDEIAAGSLVSGCTSGALSTTRARSSTYVTLLAGSTALVGSFGAAGLGHAGVKGPHLWLIERPTSVTTISPINTLAVQVARPTVALRWWWTPLPASARLLRGRSRRLRLLLGSSLVSQLYPFRCPTKPLVSYRSNRLEP
jgi:hypothetical protein